MPCARPAQRIFVRGFYCYATSSSSSHSPRAGAAPCGAGLPWFTRVGWRLRRPNEARKSALCDGFSPDLATWPIVEPSGKSWKSSIFCARNVAGLVKRVRQRSELPPNRRSTHAERPGKPGTPAAGARRARRFPWGRKRDRPPIPSQQAAPRRIAAPACPAPPQAGATALGGRPSSRSAAGHRPRTTLHAATDSTAAVRGGEAGLRRRPNPAGPGIRRAALRTDRLLHQSSTARAAAGR